MTMIDDYISFWSAGEREVGYLAKVAGRLSQSQSAGFRGESLNSRSPQYPRTGSKLQMLGSFFHIEAGRLAVSLQTYKPQGVQRSSWSKAKRVHRKPLGTPWRSAAFLSRHTPTHAHAQDSL